MYTKAVEITSKIENTSMREKWSKKLKKRYNKSRKYREELKQKRKKAFGGKLTKTPSPKSKSREEIKDQTSGNAVPAKKTTTKKKKKKELYADDEDDGISTPVLMFGLLGLVCTIGVGLMWLRSGSSKDQSRR
jgi:aminopeptidase N